MWVPACIEGECVLWSLQRGWVIVFVGEKSTINSHFSFAEICHKMFCVKRFLLLQHPIKWFLPWLKRDMPYLECGKNIWEESYRKCFFISIQNFFTMENVKYCMWFKYVTLDPFCSFLLHFSFLPPLVRLGVMLGYTPMDEDSQVLLQTHIQDFLKWASKCTTWNCLCVCFIVFFIRAGSWNHQKTCLQWSTMQHRPNTTADLLNTYRHSEYLLIC